jgi:predicted small secreted protein
MKRLGIVIGLGLVAMTLAACNTTGIVSPGFGLDTDGRCVYRNVNVYNAATGYHERVQQRFCGGALALAE